MALRIYPVGKGPNPLRRNNTVNNSNLENVWEVPTEGFEEELREHAQKGLFEAENYPLNERRTTKWANKPAAPNTLNNVNNLLLSPITERSETNFSLSKSINSNSSRGMLNNLSSIGSNNSFLRSPPKIVRLQQGNPNNYSKILGNLTPVSNKTKKSRRNKKNRKSNKSRKTRKNRKSRKTRRN
jgi:hypothetical protein